MNLFTYGSLMAADGLHEALGEQADAFTLRVARLGGWRRIWNVYHPDWSGATLNVEPRPDDTVVGVLVEGLSDEDFAVLDQLQTSHLPRETVYVQPIEGDAVSAQLYRRRKGNHDGRPSGRYRTVVQQRAYRAGWEVYESLCQGTVDAGGQPLSFG